MFERNTLARRVLLGLVTAVSLAVSGLASAGTPPPLTAAQKTAISAASPIKMTARQILASADAAGLALPTPMTTPPTMSMSAHNAATTISGGVAVLAMEPGAFTYLGSQPRLHTAYSTDFYYPGAVTRTTAPTYRGGPMRIRLGYGGRYIDFRLLGASAQNKTYRLWVDGQPTALAPKTDLLGTSQNQRLIVDFGSYATRLVELELDQWTEFGGVTREKDYNVWAVAETSPRIMGVGDSYFDGTGSDSFITGMFLQATKRLGLVDAWNVGEGGLGFVDDGSSLLTARQKLATDVLPYNPSWVVVALGINDDDKSAPAVQAEATLYFQELLAALPNTPVTVIGPWRAPLLNPPTPIFDAVKAAVQAQPEYGTRIVYYDTLADSWQQIAGYAGAVSGTGNSNVYIGTDGAHATQAGHDYLSGRIAAAVVSHARLLAN